MGNALARLADRVEAPARRQRFYAAGAQWNRTTADFIRAAAAPDLELRADLRQLRNRARMLVRDNPYARRFVRLMVRNVIGQHGIRPVPCNVGADGKPAAKANLALARAWADWGHSEHASNNTKYSWVAVQSMLLAHLVTDGELILRKRPGFANAYGYAVEVIDPDLLDEQLNRGPDENGREIKMGIEFDREGRPLTYYFWRRYPGEPSAYNDRIPVPASEIIHKFLPLRAGQSRGMSWLTPVITSVRHLEGFQEAALINARVAAAKMGFFITQQGYESAMSYEPPDSDGGAGEKISMEASPGMAEQLPPGWTFQEWDPKQPNTAFSEFTKAILMSHAAGVDISYMSLTGDLTNTNYSSGRIGLVDERDGYRVLQHWFADEVNRPVYHDWMKYALLTPMLSLPSADPMRWRDVRWHPRGWEWVDPLKEVLAYEKAISLGLDSRTHIARARGGAEFPDILLELAEENQLAEQAGVDITGAAVTVKETAAAVDTEGADESTGKSSGADEESDRLTDAYITAVLNGRPIRTPTRALLRRLVRSL